MKLPPILAILLVLCGCSISAYAEEYLNAGFKRLAVLDPISHHPMEVAYFYPSSTQGEGISSVGPDDIWAINSAKITSGRYPLVVISHGNLGSLWGHHDLASYLAKRGYIVITLSHPGDNYKDASGIGATSTIYGRPLQVSAAITAALKEPSLAPYINSNQIGFIGFSAGGGTGLFLAGAQADFQRLEEYCSSRLDAPVCEDKGKIENDRPDILPKPDPRISAFVLMAPLSVFFSTESVKNIHAPIFLYAGEKDNQLDNEYNSIALIRTLPLLPEFRMIPGAGHFVFLSPCSVNLANRAPELCQDPPGIDRHVVHQIMNADMAKFLDVQLKGR
ncbi:dienelactone hydrolase [Photorhabdus temperata]|uniref:Putative dienelactone hydrolase n=1 Tax=Photorhabdus khanii NC19 TaxID=1004151 RepID=W3V8M5_9GAMM|nr:dienelactone hydrolase [Photorhabdus khanii]ETS32296.1 putative dienelactone hydrolase [Photorhabdus khanii NC19]OHV55291.1 dienelactone hydrolase [Photorhabdus temperata]